MQPGSVRAMSSTWAIGLHRPLADPLYYLSSSNEPFDGNWEDSEPGVKSGKCGVWKNSWILGAAQVISYWFRCTLSQRTLIRAVFAYSKMFFNCLIDESQKPVVVLCLVKAFPGHRLHFWA